MPIQKIYRRVSPREIVQMVAPVERYESTIYKASDQADAKIATIDRARLREGAARAEEKLIRARADESMIPSLRSLSEIREAIVGQAPHYTPAAIRARASFDPDPVRDATIGGYFLARLAAAPVQELRELAFQAVSENRLAAAEAIRREIQRRQVPTETRQEVLTILEQAALPAEEGAVAGLLDEALRQISLAELRYSEVSSGRLRSLDRVAIAYGDTRQGVGIPDPVADQVSPVDRLDSAYSAAPGSTPGPDGEGDAAA